MPVALGERFHDAVYLLCFSWEPHIHEKTSQRHVQRVPDKVEAGNICSQRGRMELVRAKGTSITE